MNATNDQAYCLRLLLRMFYADYAARRKSHAMSQTSDTTPTSHYLVNAIVTAAAVLGILAFSLGPVLMTYPMYALILDLATLGQKNATHVTRYQKLEFAYVCVQGTITMRCTAETTSSSDQLSTLTCDVRSMSLTQFMQLQNDGKCIVADAELTNETRVSPWMWGKSREQDVRAYKFLALFLGSFFLVLLIVYLYFCIKSVKGFLVYRCLLASGPPLSLEVLRGHFLTPAWQKYFCCAIAILCSFCTYHGLYALFNPSAFTSFDSASWFFVTMLTPFCPLIVNFMMSDTMQFALSLPGSLFGNGVIDHEQIERIRREKREEERRRQKQLREDRIKQKYDADMEQLRKDFV